MVASLRSDSSATYLRRAARKATLLVALAFFSCAGPSADEYADDAPPLPRLGTVAQALDSDGDSLDDAWETANFGNLSQTGSGDYDSDGMTNLEEYVNGFNPTINDAFNDADHDRYPNIFEIRRGSNPNSSSSKPTANYTVDVAGGGTHTTISAALGAADVANGAYQIIAISPGVYTGDANARAVTIASTKPKLLLIGLQGAGKTIVDGGLANYGWIIGNAAVVSSLTFRNTWIPLYVDAAGKEVRFVDLLVQSNTAGGQPYAAGVHVFNASIVRITGSTFLDNLGVGGREQLYFGQGASTLANTVVWGSSSGTIADVSASATLTSTHSLVKGLTLAGTGNLPGSTNPLLRTDAHLLWGSPLRAAGVALPESWVDYDGEPRASTSPDIGVDQFLDGDGDGLADSWELAKAGNLTQLTSRTQDADSDGLTNDQEYAAFTNPTASDTDSDGLSDGAEVNTQGTNPLSSDTDRDDMPDGWEVSHGLSPLVANRFEDADGDKFPNVFEYFYGTDPSNRASVPTPTYLVNGAGGGTHTTISAALASANVASGAYQIIGIAPGTYSGAANLRDVTIPATKPTLLFVGLQGAAKTIIDGGLSNYGWWIQTSAVISSLTFQKSSVAFYIDSPSAEVRLVDLMVRDNNGLGYAGGVYVNQAAKVHIASSTFLENTGSYAPDVWGQQGSTTVVNTFLWGSATGPRVGVEFSGHARDELLLRERPDPERHGQSRGRDESEAPLRLPPSRELPTSRRRRERALLTHRLRRRAAPEQRARHRRRSVPRRG